MTANRLHVLIVFICAVLVTTGWVVRTQGKSDIEEQLQGGRYMVVAADGYALLLDTKTGCMWNGLALKFTGPVGTGASIKGFHLISVEGLYTVPTSAEELARTPRVFPERCVPQ